jgi:APA family basic amino acid/polyamine antiporter
MQGIWASLLALSGQYGDLLDMISFVIVLFYMITVFGVIYMRIKNQMQKEATKRGYILLRLSFIC